MKLRQLNVAVLLAGAALLVEHLGEFLNRLALLPRRWQGAAEQIAGWLEKLGMKAATGHAGYAYLELSMQGEPMALPSISGGDAPSPSAGHKGGRSRPLNFSSRFVLEVSAFEPTIVPRGPLYLADPSMSAAGRCGHFN